MTDSSGHRIKNIVGASKVYKSRIFFRQNDVLVREAVADLLPVHDPDHDGCHRSLSFCLAQTETGSNPFHLYSENLVFSYEQSLKGKISSFSPRFSPAIFSS